MSASGEKGGLDTKYPYVCHAELNAILNKNIATAKGVYTVMGVWWGQLRVRTRWEAGGRVGGSVGLGYPGCA